MSKHYAYGERRSLLTNDYEDKKVDLDDKNEVAAEEEAEVIPEPEISKITSEGERLPAISAHTRALCNLRKESSLSSDILAVLEPDTKITIYDEPGDFYRVNYKDYRGFIKKELCVKE